MGSLYGLSKLQLAPCMALFLTLSWAKPIWDIIISWIMGLKQNTMHAHQNLHGIHYFLHWTLTKNCSEVIIPFWRVFSVESSWVPDGSRWFPYNGFLVWCFQHTVASLLVFCSLCAGPIQSEVIYDFGSLDPNTVVALYCVSRTSWSSRMPLCCFDVVLGHADLR